MAELANFTAVDLSRLAPPPIVEILSFEDIYARMLAGLRQLLPDFDATVESDPVVKILQVAAYREMLLRQRVNDAARAVMPAYAIGADLDHLAALFGVVRRMITPANPATGAPAVMETDTDLRRRLVLAPEGYSVAGPEGAYVFHALSAHPDILDATATSPAAGQVTVTILSRIGSGAAAPALIAAVQAYLTAESRRPMTDLVTTQGAAIVPFQVVATITTFAGPDSAVVLADARRRLDTWIADSHRLGRDITRSAIHACLHVEGVQNVAIAQPSADIVITRAQAPNCTGVTLTFAGVGE